MDVRTTEALQTAAALANTDPAVWGEDRLACTDQLREFCDVHGLSPASPLSLRDVAQVHALRDVIRAAFTAPDATAVATALNAVVADAEVRPRLTPAKARGWRWELEPLPGARAASHVAAVTAFALLELVRADDMSRLHRCAAHGCAGVFVDTTRNRSRRYCLPEVCGNRTNVARYRARQRSRGPGRHG